MRPLGREVLDLNHWINAKAKLRGQVVNTKQMTNAYRGRSSIMNRMTKEEQRISAKCAHKSCSNGILTLRKHILWTLSTTSCNIYTYFTVQHSTVQEFSPVLLGCRWIGAKAECTVYKEYNTHTSQHSINFPSIFLNLPSEYTIWRKTCTTLRYHLTLKFGWLWHKGENITLIPALGFNSTVNYTSNIHSL